MTNLSVDEKYNLITRNLQEVLGSEADIKSILAERPLNIYWGTAATGKIHIGYIFQMMKIADYLQAGCNVTILIADLHAYLDNMKSSLELINYRTEYYTKMIQTILITMGVDISRLTFVKGTSFQLSEKYTMDMYRANSMISVKDAQHAGAEVVKQTDNPIMNGLLYPTLQALDEQYLNIDAETSGIDQRKLFAHAKMIMPKLGYKKRNYFMTEMISGLRFVKKQEQSHSQPVKLNRDDIINLLNIESDDALINNLQEMIDKYNKEKELKNNIQLEKMSSSDNNSKIDLLDTKNQIKAKINKCYCLAGDIKDNCLMNILEKLLFPMMKYKGLDFIINRPDKYGGPIVYTEFDNVKNDFEKELLHPSDFKMGITDGFDTIIKPIRDIFGTPELQKLIKQAYP
ncbi:MAG: tyrosyl-tRNA synthetase [Homavirus sp.]|uniref:tyrosine--tRNA ligase n=1 Tax=Homavirus sp. TaxID=2487769 RepID=A0A3G5A8M4_9VIRU|nr:MAG: tyrosyl-tRNA synthetase [Homavirus sp.]